MFRLFDFGKIAAGTHDTNDKEQHQQGKPDCLQCAVDIQDNRPYRTAFKLLR